MPFSFHYLLLQPLLDVHSVCRSSLCACILSPLPFSLSLSPHKKDQRTTDRPTHPAWLCEYVFHLFSLLFYTIYHLAASTGKAKFDSSSLECCCEKGMSNCSVGLPFADLSSWIVYYFKGRTYIAVLLPFTFYFCSKTKLTVEIHSYFAIKSLVENVEYGVKMPLCSCLFLSLAVQEKGEISGVS